MVPLRLHSIIYPFKNSSCGLVYPSQTWHNICPLCDSNTPEFQHYDCKSRSHGHYSDNKATQKGGSTQDRQNSTVTPHHGAHDSISGLPLIVRENIPQLVEYEIIISPSAVQQADSFATIRIFGGKGHNRSTYAHELLVSECMRKILPLRFLH